MAEQLLELVEDGFQIGRPLTCAHAHHSDREERKRHGRVDSEVAATAAPAGPKQIAVPGAICRDLVAARQYHLRADEMIDGQSVHPRVEPEASPEREPVETHRRALPRRNEQVVRPQNGIEVGEPDSARHAQCSRMKVDSSRLHPPEVDLKTGRPRVSRIAVAARASHQRDSILPRPPHASLDVLGSGAQSNAGGNHAGVEIVLRRAGSTEPGISRAEQ